MAEHEQPTGTKGVSQSIEWYHEGESRTVEIEGVRITIRLVGRKNRRARIAIAAPPGATFRSEDDDKVGSSNNAKK